MPPSQERGKMEHPYGRSNLLCHVLYSVHFYICILLLQNNNTRTVTMTDKSIMSMLCILLCIFLISSPKLQVSCISRTAGHRRSFVCRCNESLPHPVSLSISCFEFVTGKLSRDSPQRTIKFPCRWLPLESFLSSEGSLADWLGNQTGTYANSFFLPPPRPHSHTLPFFSGQEVQCVISRKQLRSAAAILPITSRQGKRPEDITVFYLPTGHQSFIKIKVKSLVTSKMAGNSNQIDQRGFNYKKKDKK